MEKIVLKELVYHLSTNKLITDYQSGFRKNRRTTDNLLVLSQKIEETIDRGKRAVLVTYDIQAAFDSVQHNFIIGKLIDANSPGAWIDDFLRDRSFAVKNGTTSSSWRPITTGVEQ